LNVPWILAWYAAARSPTQAVSYIPGLLILLLLGMTGAILIPCLLVTGLMARRWFLIAMLALVNTFWPLRWIEYCCLGRLFPPSQPLEQPFLAEMFVSSVAVIAIYWIFGIIMSRARARWRSGRTSW